MVLSLLSTQKTKMKCMYLLDIAPLTSPTARSRLFKQCSIEKLSMAGDNDILEWSTHQQKCQTKRLFNIIFRLQFANEPLELLRCTPRKDLHTLNGTHPRLVLEMHGHHPSVGTMTMKETQRAGEGCV